MLELHNNTCVASAKIYEETYAKIGLGIGFFFGLVMVVGSACWLISLIGCVGSLDCIHY